MRFKPGDVIEREKPFAFILNSNQKFKRCDYCFEESSLLKRCSKCKIMFYCSEQCQRFDWKGGHKFTECHVYQFSNQLAEINKDLKTFLNYDTPRLLLRLYLIVHYNPEKLNKVYKTFTKKDRSLKSLMEHKQEIIKHENRMLIFEDIKKMFVNSKVKFDEDLLFSLFCKMYINGFAIMNSMLLEIGRAVYILASQFDHSCVPNTITVFNGNTIEVRAIQDIDTNKQEILISYLNVMESYNKRQEMLKGSYYFECDCERCIFDKKLLENKKNEKKSIENTVSIAKNIQEASKNSSTEEKNNNNQLDESWKKLKKKRNTKQSKNDKQSPIPSRFVPYTSIEQECLNKFKELNESFTKKIESKNWPEAYALSKDILKCFLTYYRDDFNSETTLHLVQMLQIKRNLLKEKFSCEDKEVDELYNTLKKNILVTHGVGHHLYQVDFKDLCNYLGKNC